MQGFHEENDPRSSEQDVETRLRRTAGAFRYPPTPDLAARERQRLRARQNGALTDRQSPYNPLFSRKGRGWLAFAAALMVLMAGLLLATPVRARLLEWLRIGAVRIFYNQPVELLETVTPPALASLAGETTLEQAKARVPFVLRAPEYPPDLGNPQHVYLQEIQGAAVVIFVWAEPATPAVVRLALYQIGEGDVFQKHLLRNAQETTVNGQWALWVEGPYVLETNRGQQEERRIVQGRTLIWMENGITYRLETSLPLEEARKIAESLRALPEK